MNVTEDIFEIRSCTEILANIKIDIWYSLKLLAVKN